MPKIKNDNSNHEIMLKMTHRNTGSVILTQSGLDQTKLSPLIVKS